AALPMASALSDRRTQEEGKATPRRLERRDLARPAFCALPDDLAAAGPASLGIACIEFSRKLKKRQMQKPIPLVILKVVPPSPPTSIRSPEQIAMNEVSTEPIAQATEEVADVAENVESIDAPPVTEFVEPVQDEATPTENVEAVALIQDEFI